ncbi:MAG: aspartate kinase [Planctomycetota bacterium]
MSIIVQKFGGTSVADAECIKKAAAKIIRAKENGHQVVVTLSARAGMTDELIDLARSITPEPDARELDMLVSTGEQMSIALMCITLNSMGHPAISLTGGQVGIVTDSAHTRARIQSIDASSIHRELDRGKIVVVAGFQGIDSESHITTLGRGASDLTAVALAAALDAEVCEIYTDVDGIYTADPRVVPHAAKLDAISYDEILELASMGAKVIQSRSVEVAKKFHVPVRVRSTFSGEPGTVICSSVTPSDAAPVCGAALSLKESRITISGVPDLPGIAARVVGAISERGVNLDMIVQSFPYERKADMSFLVKDVDLAPTLDACQKLKAEIGARDVACDGEIARVSAVGRGMMTHEGVAARMCAALAGEGINIKMITTSEINISVVVDSAEGERALRAVHEAFGLANLPEVRAVAEAPAALPLSGVDALEGYCVQAVDCDRSQAELKIRGLADRPGQAALVLTALADAGVNLDVVLQNSCSSGISVTVSRADAARAKNAIESMSPPVTREPVEMSSDIAKISLSGVGMRSHAGAASRVFDVLARASINIQMIGTSEAKLSVAVAEDQAERAVAALEEEFCVDD